MIYLESASQSLFYNLFWVSKAKCDGIVSKFESSKRSLRGLLHPSLSLLNAPRALMEEATMAETKAVRSTILARPDNSDLFGIDLSWLDVQPKSKERQPRRRRWWPGDTPADEAEQNSSLSELFNDLLVKPFADPQQSKSMRSQASPPYTSAGPNLRRIQGVDWSTSNGDAPTNTGAYHKLSVRSPIFYDADLAAFAMYDGHTGVHAAEYSSKNLLDTIIRGLPDAAPAQHEKLVVNGINRVAKAFSDEATRKGWRGGTTAVVVLFNGKQLVVGNVGDTRVVLGSRRGSGNVLCCATSLSEVHGPANASEAKRIKARGGRLVRSANERKPVLCLSRMCGCGRANGTRSKANQPLLVQPGGLRVTRSIGDVQIQKSNPGVIISEAYSRTYRLEASDAFVIIASRELWAVLSDEVACGVVDDAILRQFDGAEALASEMRARGSQDQAAILVLLFEPPAGEAYPATPRRSILKTPGSPGGIKRVKSAVKFAGAEGVAGGRKVSMAVQKVDRRQNPATPVQCTTAVNALATPKTLHALNKSQRPPSVTSFKSYEEEENPFADEDADDLSAVGIKGSPMMASPPQAKRVNMHRRTASSKSPRKKKKLPPPSTPPPGKGTMAPRRARRVVRG